MFKVDSACATEVICILINLVTEDIYLTKGEMLRSLIQMHIELNEIATATVFDNTDKI